MTRLNECALVLPKYDAVRCWTAYARAETIGEKKAHKRPALLSCIKAPRSENTERICDTCNQRCQDWWRKSRQWQRLRFHNLSKLAVIVQAQLKTPITYSHTSKPLQLWLFAICRSWVAWGRVRLVSHGKRRTSLCHQSSDPSHDHLIIIVSLIWTERKIRRCRRHRRISERKKQKLKKWYPLFNKYNNGKDINEKKKQHVKDDNTDIKLPLPIINIT